MVFSFDISGTTLEVSPGDTAHIRLVAVVSGLLETRPHEIGRRFGQFVSRAEWLAEFNVNGDEAGAYFGAVYDALERSRDSAPRAELVVAASLLSGARKSEKLSFAFDALSAEGGGGSGGDACLDATRVARLLAAVLVGIAFASRSRARDGGARGLGAAAHREARRIADEVVSRGSKFPNMATFDDFGSWYNGRGFRLAPWLELLDLSKWPTAPDRPAGNASGRPPASAEDEAAEEGRGRPAPRAVVAFEVATDDGSPAVDDDQRVVLRAAFSEAAVARLRDLVTGSGLADCEASVLVGQLARAATPAGRIDARSFSAVLGAFEPFTEDAGERDRRAGALHYLYGAFVRDADLGADASELAAGLALLCAGSKSVKLAVAWEVLDADRTDGALTRRGLWRYLRAFLVALLALASVPDGEDDLGDLLVDVHDDADDAAVTLAATIFHECGCDDLIGFDDFADWYTDGGFKFASWLELLDLSKWVL